MLGMLVHVGIPAIAFVAGWVAKHIHFTLTTTLVTPDDTTPTDKPQGGKAA